MMLTNSQLSWTHRSISILFYIFVDFQLPIFRPLQIVCYVFFL
eukprot:UN02857